MDVQENLLRKTQEKSEEIPAKDLARSAAAAAQVGDLNLKGAQLLRNEPTEITEIRNPAEIIRELEQMGVVKPQPDDIEGEAEEMDSPAS